MCIVFLAFDPANPDNRLTVLANRDEIAARPTQALNRWPGSPVIAGRDLEAGGSWLGVTPAGRFAAITNVRAPGRMQSGARSRGALVTAWLQGQAEVSDFADELMQTAGEYNPFNLVFGHLDHLMLFDGVREQVADLPPGIHAVCNGSPAELWPKMRRGRDAFETVLSKSGIQSSEWLAIARDQTRAPDEELPSTGVGRDIERSLSSICIPLDDHGFGHYGTVSTTLLRWTDSGGTIQEWNWREGAENVLPVCFDF